MESSIKKVRFSLPLYTLDATRAECLDIVGYIEYYIGKIRKMV